MLRAVLTKINYYLLVKKFICKYSFISHIKSAFGETLITVLLEQWIV